MASLISSLENSKQADGLADATKQKATRSKRSTLFHLTANVMTRNSTAHTASLTRGTRTATEPG